MKQKLLLAAVGIILVAAVVGYRMYTKQTPDVSQSKADVSVTATGLLADFEKDSAAARKRYIGATVEVTGTVKTVDTSGKVSMGQEGSPSEIVFGLDRRHIADVKQLTVGGTATLQGTCISYEKASGDPDDLLAALGSTIQFSGAGIKKK